MQRLWLRAVAKTKSRSPVTFEQWFSGVQFDGLDENTLQLSARNEFVRDWVHDHFVPDFSRSTGCGPWGTAGNCPMEDSARAHNPGC